MNKERIYLSPPNVGEAEKSKVLSAMESGWIAPMGPTVEEFESKLQAYFDRDVLTLNSGTSALHLALKLAGVGDGDHVLVSSHTFAACANVVLYERAVPVFIDSESETWNLDPTVLEEYLKHTKIIPKALIVTHIYGIPAKIDLISRIATKYGIKVIEDAAESLGSTLNGKPTGTFGDFGIISFNGNKIVTTSTGGALICSESEKKRASHLASQANSGRFGYDHKEVGYNYGMSNVLAGIGVEQFRKLETFIRTKRSLYEKYVAALGEFFDFPLEQPKTYSNRWLCGGLIRGDNKSVAELVEFLDAENIESRRFWKPLHLHEAYKAYPFIGTGVCEELFSKGVCLPSGTQLSTAQQELVIDTIKDFW